jgi:naphthalene 1,2-dioxygenase ferredoxin reductase component
MPKIHIVQWPEPVEAGKLRILEAALDAGVPFPHGCGTGECGTCKCELIDGDIRSDRYSPDALSLDEIDRGLILACRARALTDVKVRWLSQAAALPMIKLDAKVSAIDRVAHDVMVLRLSLPEGKTFMFRPGQFVKLGFGKLPARSYSMANQPAERELVFHIRIVPNGLVSGHVARELKVGDRVEVRGPFGDAYWDGKKDAPLLLLAGGTGLAPILSVLDAAIRDGQQAEQIHLYHGVRSERDLYAGDLLRHRAGQHRFRFVPVFANGDGLRSGHLHEAVASDFDDLRDAHIYTAGPPPMVDAVKEVAVQRGMPSHQIRADAFFASEPERKSLWGRLTTAFGALN